MKFSIIVPVYNVELELPRCIKSLVSNISEEDEIILVNDGSTDNSGDLCDKYATSIPSVKTIHKKNGGLSSARNAGLKVAQGDFILFVDSDDALSDDAIATLKQHITNYPDADFIQFGYREIFEEVSSIPEKRSQNIEYCFSRHEFFMRLQALGGCGASACTKLVRKGILDTLSFKEGIIHEDEFFTTQLLSVANQGIYTDAELYLYYIRENSIVTSNFSPKKLDVFLALENRIKTLEKLEFTDLLSFEYLRYARTCLNLYYEARLNGFIRESENISNKLYYICPYLELAKIHFSERIFYDLHKKYSKGCVLYYALRRIKNKGILSQVRTASLLFIDNFIKSIRRLTLANKDFTIISNNCWGGFIYQHYGLKYTSPTVGLFILESDYIRMLEDLKTYMSSSLEFIEPEQATAWNKVTNGGKSPIKYPVAKLIDIEIFFMHYHSPEEAAEKWYRRVKRINWDNLIIKMSQRNDCNIETLHRFANLPFKKKICFVQPENVINNDFISVPELEQINTTGGDETTATFKYIQLNHILN